MAATKIDIVVEKGATFSKSIKLEDASGTVIDLTGWTGRGQIRRSPDSPDILAPFTVTVDGDPTLGMILIKMSAALTAALPTRRASNPDRETTALSYDIELVKPNTEVLRLLEGQALVSPEVTR